MKKIVIAMCISLCVIMICNNLVFAYTGYGTLRIGDEIIEGDGSAYFEDNNVFLPLRNMLEAIGAKVEWVEETKKIYITYQNEEYVMKLKDYYVISLNQYNINEKKCLIGKTKYDNSTLNGLFIQLSGIGAYGYYETIDDKTYIDGYNMVRLMYYFGYYVKINKQTANVYIFPVGEKEHFYNDDEYLSIVDDKINIEADTWLTFFGFYEYMHISIIDYSIKKYFDYFQICIKFKCEADIDEILRRGEWVEINNVDETLYYFNDVAEAVYKLSDDIDSDDESILVKYKDYYIVYGKILSEFILW